MVISMVNLALAILVWILVISSTPSSGDSDMVVTFQGAPCNDVGNVESSDPCRPLCACMDGHVVCAEIHCSTKELGSCGKVTPVERCCPTYVCYEGDGSSYMRYPLPRVIVPSDLLRFINDHKTDNSTLFDFETYKGLLKFWEKGGRPAVVDDGCNKAVMDSFDL